MDRYRTKELIVLMASLLALFFLSGCIGIPVPNKFPLSMLFLLF
jgi:hypothetical protein